MKMRMCSCEQAQRCTSQVRMFSFELSFRFKFVLKVRALHLVRVERIEYLVLCDGEVILPIADNASTTIV